MHQTGLNYGPGSRSFVSSTVLNMKLISVEFGAKSERQSRTDGLSVSFQCFTMAVWQNGYCVAFRCLLVQTENKLEAETVGSSPTMVVFLFALCVRNQMVLGNLFNMKSGFVMNDLYKEYVICTAARAKVHNIHIVLCQFKNLGCRMYRRDLRSSR